MATGPRKTPSSKSRRKPVTIDAEAAITDDVSSLKDAEPVAMETSSPSNDTSKGGEVDEMLDAKADGKSGPPKAQKPEAKKSGSSLVGGLVGGVLALAGAGGLQWAGVLPNLGAAAEAPTVDLAPIEQQIAELRSTVGGIEVTSGADTNEVDLSGINARIDELAASIPAVEAPDLSAITDRLSAVETALSQLDTAVQSGDAGDGAAVEAVSNSMTELRGELEALATQVAGLPRVAQAPDLSGVEERIAAAETAVEQSQSSVEAFQSETSAALEGFSSELQTLASSVESLSAQVEAGGADSTTVARAFAASSLKNAVDRGGAFATELEAFATVAQASDADAVSTLREFAAAGVPTLSQIVADYPSAANAIIATERAVDEDAGIAGQLFGSLQGLVSVRPVDEQVGDTPTAISTRIGARLAEGNLDAALAEWDSLPQAAKAASQPFIDSVNARKSVDGLMSQILTSAMSGAASNAQ